MKKIFYLTPVFLLIINCTVTKKPVFIKVDHIKIISANMRKVTLSAAIFFKNPNDIGGELATDSIHVWVNGTKMAKVISKPFRVPVQKEFSMPMIVEIPTEKFLKNNKNGLLGGLLNSFANRTVQIQFKGNLYYKVLGFSKVYSIDKTEKIKIKL